jgi:GrpB-like predicted nucleotidyltransferase (UPF0157 family)/ribosomal protein S18 acetylase RimI-like enzyme
MAAIREADSRADITQIRLLFEEYARSLGVDLSFQDFNEELASLPGAYSGPGGRLFLAADGARAVGCVGVRPLGDGICEMKRLYVRPEARGQALGRTLAEAAITFAKAANYHAMRLDTLPTMAAAQDLYKELGFRDVAPYRYNPVPGTAFMQLDLQDAVNRGRRIEVVAYDPGWPAAFDAEAARLRAALGPLALRIDHNGSTAIPGLGAKPVIDIQISVAALQPLSIYGSCLEAIGYVHLPHPDDSFCPFFHRPGQWPHSHHVHVVERGGREERRTLAFRDYLREHPAVAREYEDLKRATAARLEAGDAESRECYAQAKTEFIERVVSLALAMGFPRDPAL